MGMGPVGQAVGRKREQLAEQARQRQAQSNQAHGRVLTPSPGAQPLLGGAGGGPMMGQTTRLGGSTNGFNYQPNRFSSMGPQNMGMNPNYSPAGPVKDFRGGFGGTPSTAVPPGWATGLGNLNSQYQPQQPPTDVQTPRVSPGMQNQMAMVNALRRAH